MACRYIYKGHEFNSELELDDFILDKLPFESTLGDMVFSNTDAQNLAANRITQIENDSSEVRARAKEIMRKPKEYTNDGESYIKQRPFIGVNRFVGQYHNWENTQLVPEFRDDSYWLRRFADWRNGDYTDDEKALFGITTEKGPRITSESEANNRRKQMEHKWKSQAKAGDAIHNVLQLFFTRDDNGEYLFNMSDNEFLQHCLDHLEDKNKPYITEPLIKKVIAYARKLYEEIKSTYGENCIFYPEFTVTADTNTTEPETLLGMIDLLIVDERGRIHILDYKTSLHNYSEFSSEKRAGYNYQQAIYQRMLEKYGLNTSGGKLMIAPIQLTNFHIDSDDKWTYDDISYDETLIKTLLTQESNWDRIFSNIDEFLTVPIHVSVTTSEALSTIKTIMNKWFPDFPEGRLNSIEAVINWLKRRDMLKKDDNGQFVFNRSATREAPIISDNETEFVQKVAEYFAKEIPKRTRKSLQLKAILQEAMEKGINNVQFPTPIYKSKNLSWLKDTLNPYCNGNWEIDDSVSNLLDQFGLIMLKTKDGIIPPQIDFVRVSTRDLGSEYRKYTNKENPYRSRTSLIGALEPDIEAYSKQNNFMAEAFTGNVELMETMLLLNQIEGLNGKLIGNIQVVNPSFGDGIQMSNEQLQYCFNEFCKKEPIANNRFASGEIQLASRFDQVRQKTSHVLATGFREDWQGDYRIFKNFQTATSILDQCVQGPAETEERIKALQQCLDMLTGKNLSERSDQQKELDKVAETQHDLKKAHVDLYNTIVMAIGELRGVKYRQQLKDHEQWFSDILKANTEGLSGNYSDNPGNLQSETLNLVTKLVTEAYQNVRDEMQQRNIKLRKLVQNLKDELGMGSISENTFGNQASLYKKMFRTMPDGDIWFVNPNTLQGAQREFLEFALEEINKDRLPASTTKAQREAMRDHEDPQYYQVPLCVGGFDSTASERGLLSMLRAKLEYLWPPKAWELAKKKMEGIVNREDEDRDNKSVLLYKMTNIFDIPSDKRVDKIATLERDKIPLERNLETLVLKHMFAYSVQRNMDEVFPLIKSAMIHIQSQGAQQSTTFKNDIQYFEEYIRNKIYNKSIVEPTNERWVKYANSVKKAASLFTLAVAPVQMFYQPLQGLWNDISLMIRKPDQKDSFTFQHFLRSFKLVFRDLAHFSDKPTLCSALNQLYGINDMDMNQYVDRISTAKKGIWNAENFLFKFASRPDFYNRMTIFISQMQGDGCLEAHSLDADGRLVYDWTKDKRFSKFAEAVRNGNINSRDPEVAKQKSLYYTVAQQFVAEHAKNSDGSIFELNMNNPKPLPRAYTNKQAESMKSLGDNIYGYYSHEKKSLIMSTCIGSLWLQFRTYWSGKKNQYLAPGGVKLQGDWLPYEENGVKYYYQTNENGVVLYNEPPIPDKPPTPDYNGPLADTADKQLVPVMQWRGQWQEGIILTLSDLVKNMWNTKSFKKGWEAKFGDDVDPYLRKVYTCNMQQLVYDFIMFAVIGSILGALLGDWLDKLKADNVKNRDFVKGLGVSAANIAVMSVKNSFLDFNFFTSIADPFGQWTPFAVDWGARTFKNWYNVAVGDEDFWDGVVKTSGGLKQIKPALDTLKPDFWRTEREGGTFNKED